MTLENYLLPAKVKWNQSEILFYSLPFHLVSLTWKLFYHFSKGVLNMPIEWDQTFPGNQYTLTVDDYTYLHTKGHEDEIEQFIRETYPRLPQNKIPDRIMATWKIFKDFCKNGKRLPLDLLDVNGNPRTDSPNTILETLKFFVTFIDKEVFTINETIYQMFKAGYYNYVLNDLLQYFRKKKMEKLTEEDKSDYATLYQQVYLELFSFGIIINITRNSNITKNIPSLTLTIQISNEQGYSEEKIEWVTETERYYEVLNFHPILNANYSLGIIIKPELPEYKLYSGKIFQKLYDRRNNSEFISTQLKLSRRLAQNGEGNLHLTHQYNTPQDKRIKSNLSGLILDKVQGKLQDEIDENDNFYNNDQNWNYAYDVNRLEDKKSYTVITLEALGREIYSLGLDTLIKLLPSCINKNAEVREERLLGKINTLNQRKNPNTPDLSMEQLTGALDQLWNLLYNFLNNMPEELLNEEWITDIEALEQATRPYGDIENEI
jgi:hypothetical protein